MGSWLLTTLVTQLLVVSNNLGTSLNDHVPVSALVWQPSTVANHHAAPPTHLCIQKSSCTLKILLHLVNVLLEVLVLCFHCFHLHQPVREDGGVGERVREGM